MDFDTAAAFWHNVRRVEMLGGFGPDAVASVVGWRDEYQTYVEAMQLGMPDEEVFVDADRRTVIGYEHYQGEFFR